MAKSTKPVWILCPRCELNYIKKADQYCNVCKKEMKLIKASEDDIDDLELCPICKINFVQNGEEVCDSCKQELGIVASEEDEDREVADWHKYIDDDDEDDEEEGNDLADDIYSQDELEETSGIDEDFDFGGDLSKDLDDEDDEDEDEEDFDFDIDDDSFDDDEDEEDEDEEDDE